MQNMIKNKTENTTKNKITKTNSFEETEIVPTTVISGLSILIKKKKKSNNKSPKQKYKKTQKIIPL